ncbi:pectinesterase-like [Wolffia australiana]
MDGYAKALPSSKRLTQISRASIHHTDSSPPIYTPSGAPRSSRLLHRAMASFLFLFLSSLLLSTATPSTAASAITAACTTTLYPDLCLSSLSANPAISTKSDAFHHFISLSQNAVKQLTQDVKKLRSPKPDNGGISDCLQLFDKTADELAAARRAPRADDVKTLLSAAMTNQDTCLDSGKGVLREEMKSAIVLVSRLCSNALAIISEEREEGGIREKTEVFEVDDAGFPEWMTEADRRILQGAVAADVVVAADGSGKFRKISEAVAAAPSNSGKRYVIRIKAGTYKENVEVPKGKTNLMFVGDGIGATVISGSRNVVDGSTTFNSATVAIVGGGFLARDLTIENTAGPSKHQAVALRVGADLAAFYKCEFRAYQDTLYVHSLRQFFRECTISGTVDFIFGNSAVVIQNSNIIARKPDAGQKNMVTAQGREDPNQNTGISIQRCTINGASDLSSSTKSYLGRPWKLYSRTVVMQTAISSVIDPAGWFEWDGSFALNTLTYREYQNTGSGAGTAGRVKWSGYKVITSASEAQQYTPGNFISGGNWLGATGFPFTLGL